MSLTTLRVLAILIYTALGFALAFVQMESKGALVVAGEMALGIVLGLWIHELGHLAGAKARGMEVRQFAVGMVQFVKSDRWTLSWAMPLAGSDGYVLAFPSTNSQNRLGDYAVFVAAGPAANLIFGVGWLAGIGWNAVGLFSIAAGILNLIPAHGLGLKSDGAQLLAFAQRDPIALAQLELQYWRARLQVDLEPSGLPVRELESMAERLPDLRPEIAGFLYAEALQRSDFESAERWLLVTLDGPPGLLRSLSQADAAHFYAWHRRDIESARRHLAEIGSENLGAADCFRDRAIAAIALREGRPSEARASLERARRGIEGLTKGPLRRLILSTLDSMESEALDGNSGQSPGVD